MVDEIVVGFEDAVGEPVVAHELPDVLDRVELWAFRRQQNDGDIGRHEEARGQVPAGLVDQGVGGAAGGTVAGITAGCKVIASGLQGGMIKAATLPSFGETGTET